MRKNLILGLALSSALAIGSFTAAGQGLPNDRGFQGMMDFHTLNLTDAQKDSIEQLVQSNFAQSKSAFRTLRQQMQALEAMKPTDAGYQSAATSLAQAVGADATARVQRIANIRAQIYNMLTPAQQSQLATQNSQAQALHQQWEQFRNQQQKAADGSSTSTSSQPPANSQ